MTPKKTAKVQPKYEYEEEVIPQAATEYEERNTVAVNDVTIATKPAPEKSGTYVAYAPFDHDGEHYETGDEFTPRKSWLRDTAFEEFRSVELKRGGAVGIAFLVPGEIIDKKTGDRAQSRQILPVKEA
jgi:hypothetical protein